MEIDKKAINNVIEHYKIILKSLQCNNFTILQLCSINIFFFLI